MTTLENLNFTIHPDDMKELIRIIQITKTNKVEDFADQLFDGREPAVFTEQEIALMQETAISDITMGETLPSESFDLYAKGKLLFNVSARPPTKAELRGGIVRTLIIEAQKTSAETSPTLYQVFQSHIRNVVNNPLFIAMTNKSISIFLGDRDLDRDSPIFQILFEKLKGSLIDFGLSIFNAIDEPNTPHLRDSNFPPDASKFLKEKLDEALKKAPISEALSQCVTNPHVLAAFTTFEVQLREVDKELSRFTVNSAPFIAANALKDSLIKARDQFFHDKITPNQFKTDCGQACETASESVLKDLHGWKEMLANIAFIVISIVTLGLANLISKHALKGEYHFLHAGRDRMDKIQNIKETMKRIHSTDNPSPEDKEDTCPRP